MGNPSSPNSLAESGRLQKLFDVPERVGAVPPLRLFDDVTFLGHGEEGENWKRVISRELVQQGYIPVIDQHERYGWVFHTLYPPDGTKSVKGIASEFRPPAPATLNEKDVENAVAERLRESGLSVRQQVSCAAGIADIVTPLAIFEIKLELTRECLFSAIGQVLLYREAINPALIPYVIGFNGGVSELVPLARAMGVIVEFYDHTDKTERKGADGRTINTANIGKPKADPPPSTDPSEYTRARPTAGYNPARHVDNPKPEPAELEATGGIRQLDKLEHAELVAAEIAESAAKPLPAETHYTRTQAHMQSDAYQRVEFLRRHIPPLAQLPEGQLAQDLQLPDSVAIGLPRLFRHIVREAGSDKLITVT